MVRRCPFCAKPSALHTCCSLGKIPPNEWSIENMIQFLDVLKSNDHKWFKTGSLDEAIVNAPLTQGGYKEIFRREKVSGKLVIGKQRKTLSDMMKRFGIVNIKHRDLICEAISDISKPAQKISEQVIIEELLDLVRNNWIHEKRPDIQLEALTDLMHLSDDSSKHDLLFDLSTVDALTEIVRGPNPFAEQTKDDHLEHPIRNGRRGSQDLAYIDKKEIERQRVVQAKGWIQSRADYGSLMVLSFIILEKLSKGIKFKHLYIENQYCNIFVKRLAELRDAEKHLKAIRAVGRGQFLNLLTSEVLEQQLVILSTIYNLCTEHPHKVTLVEQGVAKAVIELASHNLSIQTICLQILNALSLTGGNTEESMVKDGALQLIVQNLQDGFGDNLFLALCVLSNLAFVPSNSKAIIDCGCLPFLTNIMRRGDDRERLKSIDVIRNLAAAGAMDERLILTATRSFGQRTDDDNQPYEQKLRSFLALRSLARFEQSLKPFREFGILDLAISLLDGPDVRLRMQALGLLVNVLGNTAIAPVDTVDDDSDSDLDLDKYGPTPNLQADSDSKDPSQVSEWNDTHVIADQATDSDIIGQSSESPEQSKQDCNPPAMYVRRALTVLQRRVSPWLKLLSDSELQNLAISCNYVEYDIGATLTREGDRKDCMFVVVVGGFSVLMHSIPNRRNSISLEDTSLNLNVALLSSLPQHASVSKPGPSLPLKKGNPVEIMRLHSGDTTNEQSLLDGKPSEATIVAFKKSVALQVDAGILVSLLSSRPEMEGLISPGEKAMMTLQEQLKKLWIHLSEGSEIVDILNISRVELGHTRLKVHKLLLQNGVLPILEKLLQSGQLSGAYGSALLKIAVALLIGGPDARGSSLLAIDEPTLVTMKEGALFSQRNLVWYGHQHNLSMFLLAWRFMVLNDNNNKLFMRCSMIPALLRIVKDSSDSVVIRLSTSIILSLSFALQARWLLRPIMLIWLKYIKDDIQRRENSLKIPASSNIVDLAPPYHVVVPSTEPLKFELELHEAASEGGVLWMQRLVDQNGFDPSIQDSCGASAVHFAALKGRSDALSFFIERGVDVNIRDNAGCTPLAWLIMACQVEYGVDVANWPDEWQHIHEMLVDHGAEARFVPIYTFSI